MYSNTVDLHLLALTLVTFLAPVSGLVAGFYSGRRASSDTYNDLVGAFERERVATAILRDEIVELLERQVQERKRVVGERTRMEAPANAPAGPDTSKVGLEGAEREAQIEEIAARYSRGH